MRFAAVIVCVSACTGSSAANDLTQPPPEHAPAHLAYPVVDLPGDGNGAYWDAASRTLYLTDDTHDRLVAWTDDAGFQTVGTFPATTKVGLGGLARLPDGRFVTTSFGFGSEGAVFSLASDRGVAMPGLDRMRRRVAITRAPDGALYDAFFTVLPGSKHAGGVARLELAGGERDLDVPGLAKPVGLAATATTLYIGDQEAETVLAYDFTTRKVAVVARGVGVDQLTLLPDGDLVTGGRRGTVSRIARSGRVTTVAAGFEQVRGTAYDSERHRLFVVEHSAASSHHRLHIVPL
jgi:hypothetical protein